DFHVTGVQTCALPISFDLLRERLAPLVDLTVSARNGVPSPAIAKSKRDRGQIMYQAFDVLYLDGRPLVDRPLWQRKNRLHDALRSEERRVGKECRSRW